MSGQPALVGQVPDAEHHAARKLSHSCAPSSWWTQFESSYPMAHSCTSCSDDKTFSHVPQGGGPRHLTLSPDGSRITAVTAVTAVLSNFGPDY